MPSWLRDFFVLPLIVGAVVAALTFGLPYLFRDKEELSYSVEGPTRYLDDPAVKGLKIQVNGLPVSNLFAYHVRVWNSGNKSIKALPVRLVFGTAEPTFTLFTISHLTAPAYEFGGIKEEVASATSRRLVYDLLNPKDQDTVTALTNMGVPLQVFAKAEGLVIKQEAAETGRSQGFGVLSVAALAAVAAFLNSIAKVVSSELGHWLKLRRGR